MKMAALIIENFYMSIKDRYLNTILPNIASHYTDIFMNIGVFNYLSILYALNECSIKIQRFYRKWSLKKKQKLFEHLCAQRIQRAYRAYRRRKLEENVNECKSM